MLLGFWLVLINSIINTNLKNSYSVLDKYLALAFVIGIFLSQSWGAIFGLIMGISAIFFSQKKINLKIFSYTILFGFVVLLSMFVCIFIGTYLVFTELLESLTILANMEDT